MSYIFFPMLILLQLKLWFINSKLTIVAIRLQYSMITIKFCYREQL